MIFVGVTLNRWRIFRSDTEPVERTHGRYYLAAIGPFKTLAGARFMRDFGRNNPHCQTVDQAERLAAKG